MTPLVETHSADEVARAADVGARLIGVNARDLSTFDARPRPVRPSARSGIPADAVKIAESAVLAPADVAHYRAAGADVVLIGEALVTGDPVATLSAFLEAGVMSLREAPGPYFGEFGGRYMPESLIAAIDELTAVYEAAMADPAFQRRARAGCCTRTPAGPRPSPRCRGSPSTRAARASSSSARTSTTPGRTRSTTCSARRCSPSASARPA